ncbi:MAG: MFS transporter [Chloroflexota bacterium]|nr:MFS transporter [Chloroflexota bacterium]
MIAANTDGRERSARRRLGLRANWRQFALLVVVNAFVGGMVGLERVVVPLLAEQDFGLASRAVILSFIISFGVVKALANLCAGWMSDRFGRKPILIAGWLAGLPVPLLVIFAPSWGWIVLANVLLGINHGLCWSMTVVMKIDLAGPARRGLAMGFNEVTGYLAVAGAALLSGYLAATYALRPAPFLLGIGFAVAGLVLSIFVVQETQGHARDEAVFAGRESDPSETVARKPSFGEILLHTSWKDRALFAASQAGMANNLNDGVAWGLFPLYFAGAGLSITRIGQLAAIYPAVWGIAQLGTGALSDRFGRKWMIVAGMWVQAAGIVSIALTHSFRSWAGGLVLLGLGTALVYPTLLAVVGDVAHPEWRASAVGVYRLWRDGGYAAGALLAGVLADLFGVPWAIGAIAGLTFLSGVVVAAVMYETLPDSRIANTETREALIGRPQVAGPKQEGS